MDVISRPYPMLSSARPSMLYFDIDSKYSVIILDVEVVDAPTIIYIPSHIHYTSGFDIWATSNKIEWDNKEHILSWYPEKQQNSNQIIITAVASTAGEYNKLNEKNLPKESTDSNLMDKTKFISSYR
ncbi:MAG TPA: hypothetical protein VHJ38_16950 [Nitrososphaeraceae archaeon]|jgi:hypothetical protein|nr:hypothetical protein [Nitrososphaeraceae archaeon]